MINPFASQQSSAGGDVKILSDILEEVLKYSGDKAGEKYVELKARAEQTLTEVKSRVSSATNPCCAKAHKVALQADSYVKDNPWHGVGVGATVGLIIGLLLHR